MKVHKKKIRCRAPFIVRESLWKTFFADLNEALCTNFHTKRGAFQFFVFFSWNSRKTVLFLKVGKARRHGPISSPDFHRSGALFLWEKKIEKKKSKKRENFRQWKNTIGSIITRSESSTPSHARVIIKLAQKTVWKVILERKRFLGQKKNKKWKKLKQRISRKNRSLILVWRGWLCQNFIFGKPSQLKLWLRT